MPLFTQRSIVIIGKENTGKSQLIASLTGQAAYSTDFFGCTHCLQNNRGLSNIHELTAPD